MAEGPAHPVVGRAGGKILLLGEHAVVHGHPALALGLDRGTTVTLRPQPGPTRARPLPSQDPRLDAALAAVLPPEGWEVEITSDLPVGRGLGSSAALAVALVRADAARRGQVPSAAEVHDRAFAVERIFHGTPSGVDHLVAAQGGLLRYRRTASGPEVTPLAVPAWPLVVLDSGTAGDTAALVAAVRAGRPGFDPVLGRIGALVDEAVAHLSDPAALGPLLLQNHRLLQALGVSTPALDDLVALALGAGAFGAKLAGAGGGGIVIALAPDPDRLLEAAHHRGVRAFVARPASEG